MWLLASLVVTIFAVLTPITTASAATTPVGSILAFGDSVAAGYGLGAAEGQNQDNPSAYSAQLATSLGYTYNNFAAEGACAGAGDANGCDGTIPPVSAQINEAIGAMAGKAPPWAITLTVGANSIDFVGCLMSYLNGDRGTTADPCQTVNLTQHLNAFQTSLGTDLDRIHAAFPGVPILVTSYYDPAPAIGTNLSCAWGRLLSADDLYTVKKQHGDARALEYYPGFQSTARTQGALQSFESSLSFILQQLNNSLQTTVGSHGATYVDITKALDGRGICSGAPLLFSPALTLSVTAAGITTTITAPSSESCPVPVNEPGLPKGFDITGLSVSFHGSVNCFPHPTAAGQTAIANALRPKVPLAPPTPGTPALRLTAVGTNSVGLSWSAVSGAVGYHVYDGAALAASTTSATSTTIGGLGANSSHTYTVKAYNAAGESGASNPVAATTMIALPAAPVLRTTATTASSISLAWGAATGATGYHVYEGATLKATTSATSTTIGSLASNSTHTYFVKAYNASGESPASNSVSATTNFTYLYAVTSQTASADVGHARPGQAITITIKVTNTGTATWSNAGSNPVNLATVRPQNHASPFQSPGWISSSRPAALQQASVPPGGTGTFSFTVTAPAAAGTVTDYFALVAENKSWFNDPGTSVTVTTQPIVGVAAVPGTTGVWTVANDGGVTTSGGAPFLGSMGGQPLNAPIVGIAATPTGSGYWLVGADGGVFAFGDAVFYGSMAGRALNAPIVGIAATPSGHGYWLAGADGGVFAYGDAGFAGSMAGQALNRPIVGIAAGPDNNGYRLVGADGGVFAYGNAGFAGSMAGQPLNAPIVGIAATSDGAGYWLVGADGGIYAYGDAGFGGSLGATGSTHPAVGVTRTSSGYDIANNIGTVTTFAATPPPPPPPPPPPAPTTLFPGSQLSPGAALTSPNGRYRLVMQGDGNLVEYDGGTPVWASNTFKAGSVLLDQSDGNFVIVAPGNVPVWATGTNQPNSVITVQNDRNVVVYAPGNVPIWATNTGV